MLEYHCRPYADAEDIDLPEGIERRERRENQTD